MLTYILFIIGFVLLIKGAYFLVDGSGSIAKKLKIPSLVIGLTVVAFGTSAPEAVVNVLASLSGNTEIAIGNILGSNIANIFLILGISSIIYPLTAQKNTVIKEIPFSLLAALLVGFMANDMLLEGRMFSEISRIDGLILLSFFVIFIYYIVGISKNGVDSEEDSLPMYSIGRSIFFIFFGLVGLVLGGKWIVDGAVAMALSFGVSQSLVGLTIVAIGTSLPELATSVVAARKKQSDIAIGNIVGSNIFNIFWILGISALINPMPFSAKSNPDIFMAIVASLLLFQIGRAHV